MYVSGELAGEPELAETLGNELGFTVAHLVSPLKSPKGLDPSPYLTNVGLAIKEINSGKEAGPSIANVNSLPAPYRSKPFPVLKFLAIPGIAAAMGILILMVMFIQDASATIASGRIQLDGTNEIIEQRQAQKKELTESIAQLEKKIPEAKSSVDTFVAAADNLYEKGEIVNGDLAVTPEKLYTGMNLTRISHNGSLLTIQGRAPSEAEILYYARSLNDTGRFLEITITLVHRLQDDEGMDFILALKTGAEGKD